MGCTRAVEQGAQIKGRITWNLRERRPGGMWPWPGPRKDSGFRLQGLQGFGASGGGGGSGFWGLGFYGSGMPETQGGAGSVRFGFGFVTSGSVLRFGFQYAVRRFGSSARAVRRGWMRTVEMSCALKDGGAKNDRRRVTAGG